MSLVQMFKIQNCLCAILLVCYNCGHKHSVVSWLSPEGGLSVDLVGTKFAIKYIGVFELLVSKANIFHTLVLKVNHAS